MSEVSVCLLNISRNGNSTTSSRTLPRLEFRVAVLGSWEAVSVPLQESCGTQLLGKLDCCGCLWDNWGTQTRHVGQPRWPGGLSWALQQKKIFPHWLLEDHSCDVGHRTLRSILPSPHIFTEFFYSSKSSLGIEKSRCVYRVLRDLRHARSPLKLPFISRYNWPNSLSCFGVLTTDIAQGKAGQWLQIST